MQMSPGYVPKRSRNHMHMLFAVLKIFLMSVITRVLPESLLRGLLRRE